MRHALLLLLPAILFAAVASVARADDYVVVSSSVIPKEQALGLDELRSIFLGNKLFWGQNERIHPFCSNLASPQLAHFLHDVLGMEPDQYVSYWRRKLFSGKGHPPKEFGSDAEALGFIRSNPSSIGVLSEKPRPQDSQGLAVFRVDVSHDRLVPSSAL
jgi:hypothetical protein